MQILIILALMFAEKSVTMPLKQKIALNITAILFLNFAIGIYPSVISMMAVLVCGKMFIDSLDWENSFKSFRSVISRYKYVFIDIFIAGIIFKFATLFLKSKGILLDFYAIRHIELSQIPYRFVACLKAAFEHLYAYQFPFMPNCLTEIFTILLILLVFLIIARKNNGVGNFKAKFIQLLLLILTFIMTQSALMICDKPMFFFPRIEYFGTLYFNILLVGVLLSQEHSINMKNLTTILCTGALFVSIVNDCLVQKSWYLSLLSDRMFWNRVIYKLETNKDFNIDTTYSVVQVGYDVRNRKYMLKKPMKTLLSFGLFPDTYVLPGHLFELCSYVHGDFKMYMYMYKVKSSVVWSCVGDPYTILLELYNAGILKKAKDSDENLFIYNDIILYISNRKQLDDLIDNIEEHMSTEQTEAVAE